MQIRYLLSSVLHHMCSSMIAWHKTFFERSLDGDAIISHVERRGFHKRFDGAVGSFDAFQRTMNDATGRENG